SQYDAFGNVVSRRQYANTVPSGGAMRVWHRAGTNSSADRFLGTFKAGDTVTATVRFKAAGDTSGALFLGDAGGADPYDNAVYSGPVYGNDGWQTLTMSVTLKHDDVMWIYVYGDRDGAFGNDSHSVLYDGVRVSSVQQGTVLQEDFDAGVTAWEVSGLAQPASVTPGDAGSDAALKSLVASLADPARDRVTRYAYDPEGRLAYTVDSLGGVTENRYDAAGNVIATIAYAGTVSVSAN